MQKPIAASKAVKLLSSYGINFVPHKFCKNFGECKDFAKKHGYPLVLKAYSPRFLHKTEAKLLFVGISNQRELAKAYKKLAKIKDAEIMIQKFISGFEFMVGVKRDYLLGHFLLVGSGGIYTELFKDFALRRIPINAKDAKEMLVELKVRKLFKGFRGKKCNMQAMIDLMLKLSKLVLKNEWIAELDLNPVVVDEKSAQVVDVRILGDD